jgi:glycosyltransferase involved in cell wall biosynthesis
MSTIEEVLVRVQAIDIDKEILVIDDGSTDGTRQYLEGLSDHIQGAAGGPFGRLTLTQNIRVFFQERNAGKGAAVRRGFNEALGEVVVIQDADLELNPEEYPRLIEPIAQGRADVVYGSRFLGKTRDSQSYLYYLANKVLTVSSNHLTGLKLTDVWTGYKMIRRDVLKQFQLREDRFGFEPEITAKIAKTGCRVTEVPVAYTVRSRDEGKKIGWKDGVRGMWCTLRYSILSDAVVRVATPSALSKPD